MLVIHPPNRHGGPLKLEKTIECVTPGILLTQLFVQNSCSICFHWVIIHLCFFATIATCKKQILVYAAY